MKSMTALRLGEEQPEKSPPLPRREPYAAPYAPARLGYRIDARHRLAGLAGTAGIYALALASLFFTVSHVVPVQAPPPALIAIDVNQPASPPETPPKEREAPEPVDEAKERPEPLRVESVEPSQIQLSPYTVPITAMVPKPADPGPVEPETASPKTAPAPPAPQISSNGPDTWEGRVLAALNKHRRYPRISMMQRQQGVPYIRFVMDRDGRVLSIRLERSSGFPDLDREALALPKRASPLPKPPSDKIGITLELVVPVEFLMRRP